MGIKQELGKKIKRIRQVRGLTQEQLAEAVDISPRTLSGIEIGENFLTAEIKRFIDIISLDNQKTETVYKFLKSLIID